MATFSKLLSLISGSARTVDYSQTSNILALSNLQLLGSTSGFIQHKANASTTSYTLTWPAAQAALSGYVLTNDGSGGLSWAATSSPLVFADSLVNTGGTVTLVNDTPTPGATKYYGTNGASILGYYSFPASGITQLTGDVTAGPGSGSQVATLVATSNSTLTTLSALTSASTLATIGTVTTGTWNATAIAAIYGGTGLTSYVTGDLIYASATNTLHNLAIGSTGNILTVVGGIPSWQPPAASGTVTTVSVVSTNGFAGTVATATTTPAITISTTVNSPVLAGNGTAISAASTTGTGSTAVLSAAPAITGAWTLTDAGTIINSVSSTKVLAFNLSGMTAARTLTVSSSQSTSQTLTIPNITGADTLATLGLPQTFSAATTFSAASTALTVTNSASIGTLSLTNPLSIANGGTGQTSASAAFNALSPMTTLGDIIYGGTSGAGTRLAGSISSALTVLTQTGTGSVSAAPVWTASTGTGNVVLSASPTLTGTIGAAALTLSTPLGVASGGTGQSSLTLHDVLVGNGTSGITQVAPSATSGVALVSNGASADPSFTTVSIAGGGTGQTTANPAFNALSPLTTKGDRLTYGTVNQRHAVPGDYGQMIPDAQQTDGWRSATYTQLQNGKPGKNYIQYADFENNATTGWSLGTVTLTSNLPTGVPTFGSGASGNLSIAATSSSPLAGGFSLSYASSAATTAGNFVASQANTIDIADQAKVMQFSFSYQAAVNPGNGNFSGTTSNSFGVAIYDVTNSVWIIPAGVFNLVQSSGVGICTGTWQTPANMTSFRIVVYNANASSNAITMYFDDFFVGPQIVQKGPAMSDETSFTPTISAGFGTVTNNSAFYRRNGDMLEVYGTFTAGTVTAALGTWTLPAGLTIDTAKISIQNTTSNSGMKVGYMHGAGGSDLAPIVTATGTSSTLVYAGNLISQATMLTPTNVSTSWGTGLFSSYQFSVPIAGWSSNSVQSSDTDTRVVASSASGTCSGGSASGTVIVWPTVQYDLTASYNSSTGVYTCPVSGIYDVYGFINGSNTAVISLYKNSSLQYGIGRLPTGGEGNFTGSIKCVAGDTLTVAPDGNIGAFGNNCSVTFSRKSGPAVITATDTVALEYNSTAGNNITNGTLTYIDYGTKESDSTNSVLGAGGGNVTTTNTGWRFIAPVSGRYQVNASVAMTFTGGPGSGELNIDIYVNGSIKQSGQMTTMSWPATAAQVSIVTGIVRLVAGDRVELGAFQGAVGTTAMSTAAGKNRVSICRIGNY